MDNNILNIEETVKYFEEAVEVGGLVSVAMIQRKFRVGYSTAKRTLDKLIELGHVGIKDDIRVMYYRKN